MLKRPRARSQSPSRADAASPPALPGTSHHIPLAKRRRIQGPIIDGVARRDGDEEMIDDGEEEIDDDVNEEGYGGDEGGSQPQHDANSKAYAHVNQFLGSLHIEQQYRQSRTHSSSITTGSYPISYSSRDDDPPWSIPTSTSTSTCFTPGKNLRNSTAHFATPGQPSPLNASSSKGLDPLGQSSSFEEPEEELTQVISRYEDTNRYVFMLCLLSVLLKPYQITWIFSFKSPSHNPIVHISNSRFRIFFQLLSTTCNVCFHHPMSSTYTSKLTCPQILVFATVSSCCTPFLSLYLYSSATLRYHHHSVS